MAKKRGSATGDRRALNIGAADASEKLRWLHPVSIRSFAYIVGLYWHRFMAIGLSVCMLVVMAYYLSAQKSASSVISLNYESGERGTNPDGTRFSVSGLRARSVMQGAIERAGLQEWIDPDELSGCVRITPTVQRSTGSESSYYISTSYMLTLDLPEEYGELISPVDMLYLIAREYRDEFYQTHILTSRALPDALDDFSDMDYYEIGSYLELITSRVANYLQMRDDNAGSFVGSDGTTFQALNQQVTNLVSYDLAAYNAYVWENGIARDQAMQVSVLTQRNAALERQYEQYTLESEMYKLLVDEYDNDMTASVLIPTYDSTGEYYMARTKTGVDELSKSANDKLTLASDCQINISLNQDRMDKLDQSVSDAQYVNADLLCNVLRERISSIIAQTRQLDDEFINASTRSSLSFSEVGFSASESLHPKRTIAICGSVCLLLYCYYVFGLRAKLKRLVARGDADDVAGGGEE